ncbi:hypothetical protein QWI17_11865 [Gilvimarinus sp. SDUM040013]|uniref:Uncharacterized protein n=1 Tax=Gilvimarinus gilvus TaxID=3058038 RepID=A0ABU4RZS1_9GAMM|nr:hypothetical protein [Gilvimarinus sp. SDUM040013]MDO3386532.1 hypothetical protein [Gilvimarinus sp. SDUM040013]MDX6849108.1 hypothetical protein [Gilvimarinus sp. SDUM040013]
MMNKPAITTVLKLNATTSMAAGILLVLGGQWLAPWFGELSALVYQIVGAGLCVFAALVWFVQRHLPGSRAWIGMIFILDLAWLIATPIVMALFYDSISLLLHALLAITFVIVGLYAYCEYKAIHSLGA